MKRRAEAASTESVLLIIGTSNRKAWDRQRGARLRSGSMLGRRRQLGGIAGNRVDHQYFGENVFRQRLGALVVQALHRLEPELERLLNSPLQLGYQQRIQADLDEGSRWIELVQIDLLGCLAQDVLDLGYQPFRQHAHALAVRQSTEMIDQLLA